VAVDMRSPSLEYTETPGDVPTESRLTLRPDAGYRRARAAAVDE